MLKQFEVESFKGFKDRLILNLQAKDYEFNDGIVANGLVNKGIIYGKNGIGKSNLGIALFDITIHLTDKEKLDKKYLRNYLNLDSTKEAAEFKYVFLFKRDDGDGEDEVIYEYRKKDSENLIDETLFINGEEVIYFNYFDRDRNHVEKSIRGNLNIDLPDNRISVVKYVYRNSLHPSSSPLHKIMNFVDNMLWYRVLSDGNNYCGFTNGAASIIEGIHQLNKKDELQAFLKENDMDFNLRWQQSNGQFELMAAFPSGKEAPFPSLISTGTAALLLYFYWSIASFDKISFLFIDEFDAFFHYESAESIILRLNKNRSFQSLVTTHNTYLMQNKLTRPDCCFLMTKNGIKSLRDSTNKEIREAHNLEKMYINGAFTE